MAKQRPERERVDVPDTFSCPIDKSLPPWMREMIYRNLQRVSKDPDCFTISCSAPETKIWAELAFNVNRLYSKGLRNLFVRMNDDDEHHPYQVLKRAHMHAIEAGKNIKEACALLDVRYRDPRGLKNMEKVDQAPTAEGEGEKGALDATAGIVIELNDTGTSRKGQKKSATA